MLTIVKGMEGLALLAAVSLYLAPSIIADARERSDALAITLVNVLLGWTVIGWLAAFMLARRPVNERRLSYVSAMSRRATARVTIGKIVAHAKSAALGRGDVRVRPLAQQPVPVLATVRRNNARSQ